MVAVAVVVATVDHLDHATAAATVMPTVADIVEAKDTSTSTSKRNVTERFIVSSSGVLPKLAQKASSAYRHVSQHAVVAQVLLLCHRAERAHHEAVN